LGIKSLVKRVLTAKENRRYERFLQERKISYGSWVTALEASWDGRRGENFHDFAVLCAGSGELAAGWYRYIRDYFARHPEAMMLYGDEDVCDGAGAAVPVSAKARRLPWFKPDWSPDLLDSFFYFGSVTVLRGGIFRRMQEVYAAREQQEDGMPPLFRKVRILSGGKGQETLEAGAAASPLACGGGGAADTGGIAVYQVTDFAAYEQWMHICVEMVKGYVPGSHTVGHLGRILFHCGNEGEQERFLYMTPFLESLWEERLQHFREVRERGKTLVSVVVLSRDHPEILEKCLRGCLLAAEGQQKMLPFEVILVDNGSSPDNRERTEALVQSLGCRITYLYQPQKFNFSRLCNIGAAQAEGEFLFFLNDDVELCRPGCMEWLAAMADRDGAGAVGMKLYYPDSVRIQHAGITNLPMGPVHKLQFLEDDQCYYYGANRGRHNVMAVTAACLMVAKEKFREAGGFAEELEVAFNDVDFCFRLHELGYRNVCVNDLYAYHHESLSRGADETPEKLERLLRERDVLYGRHPGLEGVDPYYSPYLNREGLDTGIRPAYFTAGNAVQSVEEKIPVRLLTEYRRDACLMVRIEDCREGKILGYGVVLGDNNACYERELLLWRVCPASDGTKNAACKSGTGTSATESAACKNGTVASVGTESAVGNGTGASAGTGNAACKSGTGMSATESAACQNGTGAAGRVDGEFGGAHAADATRRGTACAGRNGHMEGEVSQETGNGEEPEQGTVYAIRLAGQYRPDLEINMPDQENVGLCGFWVEIGEHAVPPGRYRIGMGVRNRVTGLRLVNWSSRFVGKPS